MTRTPGGTQKKSHVVRPRIASRSIAYPSLPEEFLEVTAL